MYRWVGPSLSGTSAPQPMHWISLLDAAMLSPGYSTVDLPTAATYGAPNSLGLSRPRGACKTNLTIPPTFDE